MAKALIIALLVLLSGLPFLAQSPTAPHGILGPTPVSGGGGPTFVKAGTACEMSSSTGSTSCTISISPNTGDNVHVGIGDNVNSTSEITGVVWEPSGTSCGSADGSLASSAEINTIWLYTCANAPASTTGIQVSCSGTCFTDANGIEVSGEPTSGYKDVIGSGVAATGTNTTYNSGSVTTLNATDIIVGAFFASENWTSFTATSPWNLGFHYSDTTNGQGLNMVYQVVSATNGYNPAGSGTGVDYMGMTGSYK